MTLITKRAISAIVCHDDNTYLWKKHVSHCDADLVSMAVKENPELLQVQNQEKIDRYITKKHSQMGELND